MLDNWFFSSLLKKREEEKENEEAKPVLNQDPNDFHQFSDL